MAESGFEPRFVWPQSLWYHSDGRKWRGNKKSLDEGERGEWKIWIETFKKLRSWHLVQSLHGKNMGKSGNSDRFYFLGLQNHCRWWLQPWNQKTLALWRKISGQPQQHVKKQRYCFASKDPSCQRYFFFFSVVMYGYESRITRKAEQERIDAFELWCWRKLLRVPWITKRSNH